MILRESTTIQVAPGRIFGFFRHMDVHYRAWHPDHIAFRWIAGDTIVPGTVFWFAERIGGKLMEKTVVVTEVREDRYFAFAPVSRLLRLLLPRLSFQVIPEEAGCQLVAEIHIRTGPVGAWLNRKEFNAVRQHMREEGENLRRLVEAEDGGIRATG